jgi:hypothetical protein
MVAAGGINLHVQPLTRQEYFRKQRNPKTLDNNPRRQVISREYIILRYYPLEVEVGPVR